MSLMIQTLSLMSLRINVLKRKRCCWKNRRLIWINRISSHLIRSTLIWLTKAKFLQSLKWQRTVLMQFFTLTRIWKYWQWTHIKCKSCLIILLRKMSWSSIGCQDWMHAQLTTTRTWYTSRTSRILKRSDCWLTSFYYNPILAKMAQIYYKLDHWIKTYNLMNF